MAEKQTAMTESVYYILLSLGTPNHGYGIIQNTIELTEGRLELGAGTLYGALNTLLEKGWIRLYSEDKHSRKKKQYIITDEGSLALQREMGRLQELLENGRRMQQQQLSAELEEEGGRCEERTLESAERRAAIDEKVQVVF